MIPTFDVTDSLLFILRFLMGSSLIFCLVYGAEKLGWLKNRDLAELSWKTAILASCLLLLPLGTLFTQNIPVTEDHILTRWSQEIKKTKASPSVPRLAETAPMTAAINQVPASSQSSTDNKDVSQTISKTGNADQSLIMPNTLEQTQNDLPHSSALYVLWGPALFFLLILGNLALTYKKATKSLGTRQRVAASHKAFQILYRLCDQAQIKKTPYLTHSDKINSPLCLPSGEIILPAWALKGMDKGDLTALIGHELAHLQRRDPIKLLCFHTLARLFFFQPFFLLAQKRLAELAELAADEWAARHSETPKSVANALYICAKNITKQRQQPQWGLAMADHKSNLKIRIERLLEASTSNFTQTPTWVKGSSATLIIAAALSVPSVGLTTLNSINDESIAPVYTVAATDRLRDVNVNISTNDKKNKGYVTLTDGDTEITLKWKGKFTLADDDSTLTSLAPKGYFRLMEIDDEGDERRIRFNVKNGKLQSRFSLNDDVRTMTARDKKWLKETLLIVLRHTGFNAEGRVARLYKRGGTKAVLSEMAHMRDFGMVAYAKALMNTTSLSEKDINRLVKTLSAIESDYFMRQAYSSLLESQKLSDTALITIAKAAKKIESDYEMRQLLTPMMQENKMDDPLFKMALELMETIGSDYELRQLFMAAIKSQDISDDNLAQMMTLMADEIGSDYEARQMIEAVASQFKDAPKATALAIQALDTIGSDYEARQAIQAIARHGSMTQENWINLILSAQKIGSDYECAQVMIYLMNKAPENRATNDAFEKLADTIGSDHERGKVERKLRKRISNLQNT